MTIEQNIADDELTVIEPDLMRLPRFVTETGIPRSTVYDLIHRGEIDAIKIGRATFIQMESYARFLDRQRWKPNRRTGA